MTRPRTHSRSESITEILEQIPLHQPSAIAEDPDSDSPSPTTSSFPSSSSEASPSAPSYAAVASGKKASSSKGKAGSKKTSSSKHKGSGHDRWGLSDPESIPKSHGLWNDIKSGRWMLIPASSGQILLLTLALYLNFQLYNNYLAPFLNPSHQHLENPFECLWFVSHRLPFPHSTPLDIRYGKGYKDIIFLLHHIVTFSFLRQTITLYILRPFAKSLGIRGPKVLRFQEQGYSFLYWGFMGVLGLFVMKDLPTWYYNTKEFWVGYPHWEMTAIMKYYYLLQFSYWLQQMVLIVLKIEKPRKDYYELFVHHLVTLWLIGWSYGINLTMIGNAVFVTMDVSDVFLALAKCINYAEGPRSSGICSAVAFGCFVAVWTYLRHYLNLVILWSVWYEYDLIPEYTKVFRPSLGVWLAPWMKYQVFVPILLIQLLNLFWYWMIWRILIKSIRGIAIVDDRSDDEGGDTDNEGEVVESKKDQ